MAPDPAGTTAVVGVVAEAATGLLQGQFNPIVLVRCLRRLGWLAPGGWATVETARGTAVAADGFSVEAERTYGKARITLLRSD